MKIQEYVDLRYNNLRDNGADHWDALSWAILAYPNILSVNVFIGWSV
jgi:hypothetical protein